MLQEGHILFTKDGRHTGNAVVLSSKEVAELGTVYKCRTDFGNIINLTMREVESLFYLQKCKVNWISSPDLQLSDQLALLTEKEEPHE